MKKIIVLIFSLFILLGRAIAQDDCKDLPVPLPGRLVNDFYNKIGENVKSQIETLLRKYNDSTSIEIAVVTVENIKYESGTNYATKIGNCWGVGKAKYDNGIVVFVSFEGDRAWAIVTGKGIEQYLTDFRASSIGQENLIPNLQKGNIDGAFISTVNAIINHLGWKSWEMREYWNAWDKETSKLQRSYSNKSTARGFGIFLNWVFYIGLLGYIIWCSYNRNEDIKIRRKIKSSIKKWEEEISQTDLIVPDKTWPKWALDKLKLLQKKEKEFRSSYATNRSVIFKEMKKDSRNADESLLSILCEDYKGITLTIPRLVSELQKEKALYEKNALSKLQEVDALAKNSQETIRGYIDKEGFMFSLSLIDLTSERTSLEPRIKKLSEENPNADSFKEGYNAAIASNEKVNKILSEVNLLVSHNNQISSEYTVLNSKILNLGKDKKSQYEKILEGLKKVHPKNVWKYEEENFIKVEKALSEAKSSLESALEKNKVLKVYSLEQAHKLYTDAVALIEWVEKTYKSIDTVLIDQKNAKENYLHLKSSAKSALEDASKKCNESHVKEAAKNLKEKAESDMKKAETMISSGVVDWVWLVALLVSIHETAKQSYSKASSDISSYNSYNSYHSSSSSSSSGSSFGGFGGGSFGGGGAGGHW